MTCRQNWNAFTFQVNTTLISKLVDTYIYQNYASKSEDVFAGYGEVSRARLRNIKDAYDPQGLFEKRMPGYFKA